MLLILLATAACLATYGLLTWTYYIVYGRHLERRIVELGMAGKYDARIRWLEAINRMLLIDVPAIVVAIVVSSSSWVWLGTPVIILGRLLQSGLLLRFEKGDFLTRPRVIEYVAVEAASVLPATVFLVLPILWRVGAGSIE